MAVSAGAVASAVLSGKSVIKSRWRFSNCVGRIDSFLRTLGIEFRTGDYFWKDNALILPELYDQMQETARERLHELHPDKNGDAAEFRAFIASYSRAKRAFARHLGGPEKASNIRVRRTMIRGGRHRAPRTPEHCAKLSLANRGKKRSDETRAKMRKPKSAEHRAKLSAAHKGKKLSIATRSAMSRAHTGKPLSEKQRIAISRSKLGTKYSEAHRAAYRRRWSRWRVAQNRPIFDRHRDEKTGRFFWIKREPLAA
jgi:hypothetical protein